MVSVDCLSTVCEEAPGEGGVDTGEDARSKSPKSRGLPARTVSRNITKVLFRHLLNIHRHTLILNQSTKRFISIFVLVVKTVLQVSDT